MKLSKADKERITPLVEAFLKAHEDAETLKTELYEAETSLLNCMAVCGVDEVRKSGYLICAKVPDVGEAHLILSGQTVADLGD